MACCYVTDSSGGSHLTPRQFKADAYLAGHVAKGDSSLDTVVVIVFVGVIVSRNQPETLDLGETRRAF
jgi:hypothetical protein